MSYIDGFVAAVPTAGRATYLDFVRRTAGVFRDHGALQTVDCWGDDVPQGKLTSFPMAVQCKADETVVFGWVVWPSRAVRDEGFKKAMEDPRMAGVEMPFDGKRMIFGGFEKLHEA
jgi:uncharacterized protein YbaA (DUF1428 family)